MLNRKMPAIGLNNVSKFRTKCTKVFRCLYWFTLQIVRWAGLMLLSRVSLNLLYVIL